MMFLAKLTLMHIETDLNNDFSIMFPMENIIKEKPWKFHSFYTKGLVICQY